MAPPPVKKSCFPVTPDPVSTDPIQPPTIIVIQPGSVNLRIGRASDAFPITVPHCIARKCTIPGKKLPNDYMLMRPECMHSEAGQLIRSGISSIDELLLSRPCMTGGFRQITTPQQLLSYNTKVKKETEPAPDSLTWTNIDKQLPFYVGEEALYIHTGENYRLTWPMRRGRLNLKEGPGGSLTSIITDMETIWGKVIQEQLEIPLKDLKHYRAVLLIPDVYNHKHIKALVNLLLNSLGFGAAIIHQESVCATYGSGITVACVVDVGDQKTSISCVEDGISHRGSRVTMEYGGSDVSRLFHSLLGRCGISLPEVNLKLPTDVIQMQALKETVCHLNQDQYIWEAMISKENNYSYPTLFVPDENDQYGITQLCLEVMKPSQSTLKYNVRLGDEPILAPMALFRPTALGITGDHLIRTQARFEGDSDDPHDEDYLRRTARQYIVGRLAGSKKDNADLSRDMTDQNLSQLDDLTNAQLDEDSNDVPDVMANTENLKANRRAEEEDDDDIDDENDLQLMGIDEAIIHCIEKCDSEELRRKLYSCILVVGGGFQFDGAITWLQYQVWMSMPTLTRQTLESMDIIAKSKDIDSSLTSWKGGAILACLDSSQELWIRQQEWKKFNVRLLRERAPFIW